MKSRLDRYREENSPKQNISRLSKNKHLYDDLNNKIGFEELVDFNTQTRIELTSMNGVRKNRESYHQFKDYQDLISTGNIEKQEEIKEEEEKVFDINSILEEARKNRNDNDELEKKRKLKVDDYNVLSDLNKKYLSKDENKKDEYEGLEELINTITSKTLVADIQKEEASRESDDLLSDLVATSIDLQVQKPEEYEKTEVDSEARLVDNKSFNNAYEDSSDEEDKIDDSFYTRSMELSMHDFDFEEFGSNKTSWKKGVLIALLVVILLLIVGVVSFFVLKHLGININF